MQATGYAACFETTGNITCKDAVLNFLDILISNHSWTTGGSGASEHWGVPMRMADFLLKVNTVPFDHVLHVWHFICLQFVCSISFSQPSHDQVMNSLISSQALLHERTFLLVRRTMPTGFH